MFNFKYINIFIEVKGTAQKLEVKQVLKLFVGSRFNALSLWSFGQSIEKVILRQIQTQCYLA